MVIKANILSINLLDSGSYVSLMRGNKVLYTIPIREIVEVAATAYETGTIRKGNDFVLEVILFNDRYRRSGIQN
jgi:hypothetical protein